MTDATWRGRSNNRVPFGLRGGRLHFVTDVATGLECGCVCPGSNCGQPLVARNKPSPDRKRAYYFSHAGSPAACAGRESALHRMAKEIVLSARSLSLPAWVGGGRTIAAQDLALDGAAAAEVRLLDGQLRPDVRVGGHAGTAPLDALYVEIRVTHAVDNEKADRVRAAGLSMIEIDLSEVTDEQAVDAESFAELVLHRQENRRWIHLHAPEFMATMLDDDIFEIKSIDTFRHDVPTRTGNTMHFTKQRAVRHRAGEDQVPIEIEIADTYDADGQRIDGFGQLLPYRPGLYRRNWDARATSYWDRTFNFKTYLTPLVSPLPVPQGQLF